MPALRLPDRAVLEIQGPEAASFLQGLITNDIGKADGARAIYAALLTPQGKYLFDFFIARKDGGTLFDCEAARKDELVQRLNFYKLRADVTMRDVSDSWDVWVMPDGGGTPETPGAAQEFKGGILYRDPRHPAIGARAFLPKGHGLKEDMAFKDYDATRLALGLPDGSRDMEVDRRFILEANFAELKGVDFNKGCYVGQEMTARMAHRGSLKKRLIPVTIAGGAPESGTAILSGEREAGHVLSRQGDLALALLRLEFLEASPLRTAGNAQVHPAPPPWLQAALAGD
jgi:tRNA-modifying protein YgfZ